MIARLVATGAATMLVTTACLGGGGGGGGGGSAQGGGDKKVEIMGAFPGDEARLFRESMKEFESSSGITVTYIPTNNFDQLIRSRVSGNNPPDIALHPQPGVLLELAKGGDALPLDDKLDLNALKGTLIPGFLDATTGDDGKVYGVPMRMAVKSLVWYPVPEFEQAGYKAPASHSELLALTNKIKADGKTPWCLGMEAGAATGWVATDWIEEYVLRVGGPEKYDQWTKHEIPFNDPVVKQAAERFQELTFPRGNTLGGSQAMLSTPFGTAANPMFKNPPECFLHRQGNFIIGFFPDAVKRDLAGNVGLFALPPVDGGYQGKPVLGGGDLAALYKDDPDAREVMKFLSSDKFGAAWAKGGGWLSPHKTFDASNYIDDTTRRVAELAGAADVFRFDGSDLMPASVGAGSFWKGMVAWVNGQKNLDKTLSDIENSWPKS